MIDFFNQQEKIKEYIQTNYPRILQKLKLPDVDNYISDFLDLDTYVKSTQLFYDFGNYNFDNLSNESNSQEITIHIYLTFRNEKSSVLHNKMLKYASCFYEMVEESNQSFDGLVDFVRVSNVQFWEAAEANTNIKVAEITLELKTEQ